MPYANRAEQRAAQRASAKKRLAESAEVRAKKKELHRAYLATEEGREKNRARQQRYRDRQKEYAARLKPTPTSKGAEKEP